MLSLVAIEQNKKQIVVRKGRSVGGLLKVLRKRAILHNEFIVQRGSGSTIMTYYVT